MCPNKNIRMKKSFVFYACILLLLLLSAWLLMKGCQSRPVGIGESGQHRMAPDTTHKSTLAPVAVIKRPLIAQQVTVYAPDTARRNQIEQHQPIVTRVSKVTQKKFLQKPRYYIAIERIEPSGRVVLDSHQVSSPTVDFTVDQQGRLATGTDQVKQAKKRKRVITRTLVTGAVILGAAIVAAEVVQ